MTATVIPLSSHRRHQTPASCCPCSPADDFLCYPHRLAELMERVAARCEFVSDHGFCDLGTFEAVSGDVLEVLNQIVTECLPNERTAK